MLPSKIGPLYRGTHSNVTKQLDTCLYRYGIGYSQLNYLMIISEHVGINQNEISNRLNVGKASVTKAVKILMEAGLIKRENFVTCLERVYGNSCEIKDVL